MLAAPLLGDCVTGRGWPVTGADAWHEKKRLPDEKSLLRKPQCVEQS
jgi:hypothetical protein